MSKELCASVTALEGKLSGPASKYDYTFSCKERYPGYLQLWEERYPDLWGIRLYLMLECSGGCRNPGPLQEQSFVEILMEHPSRSIQFFCCYVLLCELPSRGIQLFSAPVQNVTPSASCLRGNPGTNVSISSVSRDKMLLLLHSQGSFPHRIICYFCSSAPLRECPSRHSALLL